MSNGSFDFNEFIKESKDVLVNPNYFSTMRTTGGMGEPLIKAVLYGAIAGLFTFLWNVLDLTPISAGMFGGAIGVMAFIWSIIGAIIGLFIGGVIMLVLSSISKGNTDFEANVRVTASIMVLMPVSAFFGFAAGINLYLGMIISLAISVFSIVLVYRALVQALKGKPETAKIIMYVLIAVIVLFMLVGMGAKRKASQFMENFNNSDFKELLEETPEE